MVQLLPNIEIVPAKASKLYNLLDILSSLADKILAFYFLVLVKDPSQSNSGGDSI